MVVIGAEQVHVCDKISDGVRVVIVYFIRITGAGFLTIATLPTTTCHFA
jgi:hypothetical protein